MFCKTCKRRESCVELCAEVSAHLSELEAYQREYLMEPIRLLKLADALETSWADLLPDLGWMWEFLVPALCELPPILLDPFILHFYDGRAVGEVAQTLGLHRSTVTRRLDSAVAILKREVGRRERP